MSEKTFRKKVKWYMSHKTASALTCPTDAASAEKWATEVERLYDEAHAEPTVESVLRDYGLSPPIRDNGKSARMAEEIAKHRRCEWAGECAAEIDMEWGRLPTGSWPSANSLERIIKKHAKGGAA